MKSLKRIVAHSCRYLTRHANVICAIASCTGVVYTTVEALKAGSKVEEAIKTRTEENGENLTTLEKIDTALPKCKKVVIGMAVTCGFTAASVILSENLIAAATTGMAALAAKQAEQTRYLKEVCPEAVRDASTRTLLDKIRDAPVPSTPDEALYWSEYFNEFFVAPMGIVPNVEARINDRLYYYGFASAQDFRTYMHMPAINEHVKDPRCMRYIGWDQYSFYHANTDTDREGFCLNEEVMIMDDGLEVHYLSWNADPDTDLINP